MTRDRLPAGPFLTWVESRSLLSLNDTERRSIVRARHIETIDLYVADRIATHLGHPEAIGLLYDAEMVA